MIVRQNAQKQHIDLCISAEKFVEKAHFGNFPKKRLNYFEITIDKLEILWYNIGRKSKKRKIRAGRQPIWRGDFCSMYIIAQQGGHVKWSAKKKENIIAAKRMWAAGKAMNREDLVRRAASMFECGRYVTMGICPDCGRAEIKSANLCRDRFCPTCAWRLSLRRFAEMCSTMAFVMDQGDYVAGFLTLTVKNVPVDKLSATLKKMSADWNRMFQRRTIKRLVVGGARSLEITYNEKTKEFHPHYHAILLFDKKHPLKELQITFRESWNSACREDYEPITDFRFIESERDCTGEQLEKAICETYKYAVKPGDMDKMSLETFAALTKAVYNVRTASYSGIIKAARAILRFEDTEEPTEEDTTDLLGPICGCGGKIALAAARWSFDTNSYQIIDDQI